MMLSSSLRRVAWASAVSLPGASRPSPSTLSSSSNSLRVTPTCRVQRRYSSSKPPVPPNDGSKPIDASSQTSAKEVNPTGNKCEGKVAKRRGKDSGRHSPGKPSQHTPFLDLPSVPSTQHLQPQDVHVASFFSIHRPISLTTSVPPTSSAETFNAIFTSKKQSKTQAENLIYTLASAVDYMESSIHHQQAPGSEQNDLRQGVTQASTNNVESEVIYLDGLSAQDLRDSIEEFATRLRPFNPPPPPASFSEKTIFEGSHSGRPDVQSTSPRIYSTVLTIRESTRADGHKTYEAHATPFVRNPDMSDGEPVNELQDSIDTSHVERLRRHRVMHAISVRRQRKLKMKKHKYKKLLRKTRTLRRKLEKS